MRKPGKCTVLLWAVSIFWLLLLVLLSSQNGTQTAQTSLKLTLFLVQLFHLGSQHIRQLDRLLRTLAHFGVFFVLGGLAIATARQTWPKGKRMGLKVIAICAFVGVMDEVKKLMISGRHLSWTEAGLNVLGVVCGVLLAGWALRRIAAWRARRARKAKTGAQPEEPETLAGEHAVNETAP